MVNTIGKLECDKLELQLGINSFDNPTQLSELKAWSQLMLNLIFLEKGTYPSLPDMGVGIQNYEYAFMDEAIPELTSEITRQQQTYLPEVPLNGVTIQSTQYKGTAVMLIYLSFNSLLGAQTSAIAINSSPTSRHFLDVAISW